MTHFLSDAIADVEGEVHAAELQRNIPPMRVHIVGNELSQDETPEFGQARGYKLLGTEPPQQILVRAEGKRYKAQIWCLPGFANNNILGNIYFGARDVVENAPNSMAGILVSGMMVEWHAQQELWIRGDGTNSLTVTVVEERYR